MPAMPFPCAKAEAVAAMMSAAERIAFLFLTMFLFTNCTCFCRRKGGWSLCRAVDTLLLTLVLVDARLFPADLGVSVADRMRLLRFLAAWVDCHSFMFISFIVVIHSLRMSNSSDVVRRRTPFEVFSAGFQ